MGIRRAPIFREPSGMSALSASRETDAQDGDLELSAAANTCSGMICPPLELSQSVKLPVER